ncbi:MAG TPA: TMEM175 family protein [Elusimicrobiota bacterium]|nr:TMEM175 family protein [Elusimicrobiota bacterium]
MPKGRIEAFSDGVIAIIITIMALGLRAPQGASLASLRAVGPMFVSYLLSFVFIGIYWNNHHHLFQAAKHVGGGVMWANLHLLFWLSLVPFATNWMGRNFFVRGPVALYGVVLLMAACAYWALAHCLMSRHGPDSALSRALGRDIKGMVSVVIYVLAIAAAFWDVRLAYAGYVSVAVMWLVPDRRIENVIAAGGA